MTILSVDDWQSNEDAGRHCSSVSRQIVSSIIVIVSSVLAHYSEGWANRAMVIRVRLTVRPPA